MVCERCGSAILDGKHLRHDLHPCYGAKPKKGMGEPGWSPKQIRNHVNGFVKD